MKEEERGKEGREEKRKIKLTTDSEWPYMKTSVKQSDLALSLLGDNNHLIIGSYHVAGTVLSKCFHIFSCDYL